MALKTVGDLKVDQTISSPKVSKKIGDLKTTETDLAHSFHLKMF